MVIGIARALEHDARERAQIGRKRRRKYRIAFDNAGIAIGRLLAEPGSINQRHRKPALREMERHRNADNACACVFDRSANTFLPAPRTIASVRAMIALFSCSGSECLLYGSYPARAL